MAGIVIKAAVLLVFLSFSAVAGGNVYVYLPGPLYPEDASKLVRNQTGINVITCSSINDLKKRVNEDPEGIFVANYYSLYTEKALSSKDVGDSIRYLVISLTDRLFPIGMISFSTREGSRVFLGRLLSLDDIPSVVMVGSHKSSSIKRVLNLEDLTVLLSNKVVESIVISWEEYDFLLDKHKELGYIPIYRKPAKPLPPISIFYYPFMEEKAQRIHKLLLDMGEKDLRLLSISKKGGSR